VGELSYERGEGFTGWVCETGQPSFWTNPSPTSMAGKYVEFPSEHIASFLAVPSLAGTFNGRNPRSERKTDTNIWITGSPATTASPSGDRRAGGGRSREHPQHGEGDPSERMIAWGELSAKSSHMIGNRVFALKGDINELFHMLEEPSVDTRS